MRNAALLAVLLTVLAGCATLGSYTEERPQSLRPVQVEAPRDVAFSEALALAFDMGYHIGYSSRREGVLETDMLISRSPFTEYVRRLDVLVREAQGDSSRVHVRYYSFDARYPDDYEVYDADRRAARDFVRRLQRRLGAYNGEGRRQRP